eukprot:GHUV01011624.1.p1 GENE.GHUV01011624.1~~GHUV01011624.1.p1  ORF type:complete len:740 (+),score=246.31 GHUV01011624.1:1146-3365(+)
MTTVAGVHRSQSNQQQRRVAYDIVPHYKQLRQALFQLGSERHQERKAALQDYSSNVLEILKGGRSDPSLGPPTDAAALHLAYEAGLWQLLDLFLLSEDTQEGFFAEAFAAWLAEHGGLLSSTPGYNTLAADARRLTVSPRIEIDPTYWPIVQRLVLVGQLETAAELLMLHPAYRELQNPGMATQVESIEVVYQLLRVVPRFSRAGSSSSGRLGSMGTLTDDLVQFGRERAEWRKRVDELWAGRERLLAGIKKHDSAAAQGLAGILCLLCAGSDNAANAKKSFEYSSNIATNWVELLTGVLLWKYTTLQPQIHLRQLLATIQAGQKAHERDSDGAFLDFLHELLPASADQEVQSVVSLCTNSPYCSLQFVAHIFDVLRGHPAAERIISRPRPHYGVDQAELYTLNYAETLLGHADTWLMASEYLAWCPVNGAAVMEAVIDQSPFPVQDERMALKALALAQRHGLTAAAAGLCRRLGRAAAQDGRLGAALQWTMRAHDPAVCAELVAPLLAQVQQLLLEQVGNYQVAPLAIPELQDLQPLLAHLPQQHSLNDLAGLQHQLGNSSPSAALQTRSYQELHFLRAFARLQAALADVQRHQQQPGEQQQLLAAAYAAVREPVVQLLLEGLAPAPLQLPLLLYLVPVLDSVHMPFSRADVHGLLQLVSNAAGGLPAAAAAILAGEYSPGLGPSWPLVAGQHTATAGPGEGGGKQLHPRHVNDVRMALCRCLVKAHVAETGQQVRVN